MDRLLGSSGRLQTLGEEIANSVTHGVGLLLAIVAAPLLIGSTAGRGDGANVVGAGIFAATVVLVYLTSTLYHAWPHGGTKGVLRMLDHGAIYLLIAGTYTPFTLGVLSGPWGWTLFALEWTLAVAGIVLKATGRARHPVLSAGIYVAMGWLMLIAVKPLWSVMPGWGWFWLIAGGVAYTVGIGFYAAKQLPYAHLVWHVFVFAGTFCHYIAVFWYAIG